MTSLGSFITGIGSTKPLLHQRVAAAGSLRTLGMYIGANMTKGRQVTAVCMSCNYNIRALKHIHVSTDPEVNNSGFLDVWAPYRRVFKFYIAFCERSLTCPGSLMSVGLNISIRNLFASGHRTLYLMPGGARPLPHQQPQKRAGRCIPL